MHFAFISCKFYEINKFFSCLTVLKGINNLNLSVINDFLELVMTGDALKDFNMLLEE